MKKTICLIAVCCALIPTSYATRYVKLTTSEGPITLSLNDEKAPLSVKNFLQYVSQHKYDNTIFHRVIPGFMIQGGGFNSDMQQRQSHAPITNESNNGLKNTAGSIAMARTADPDSATNQFFINLADNDFLNAQPDKPGYAVFGHVIGDMKAVNAISHAQTHTIAQYADVPNTPITIIKAEIIPKPTPS